MDYDKKDLSVIGDYVYYSRGYSEDLYWKIKQDKKKINNVVKNVIFVGHVMRSKGIDELLEVSKLFPNITFNIVGEIKQDYLEINHFRSRR